MSGPYSVGQVALRAYSGIQLAGVGDHIGPGRQLESAAGTRPARRAAASESVNCLVSRGSTRATGASAPARRASATCAGIAEATTRAPEASPSARVRPNASWSLAEVTTFACANKRSSVGSEILPVKMYRPAWFGSLRRAAPVGHGQVRRLPRRGSPETAAPGTRR